jgi:glycosyltransferase involved in cell wall biosynthesis
MHCPKLTVLMSVYNGQQYLAQAIQSILEQTFEDFEFLIINDGSTEPVGNIISSYKDDRIIVVNQENIGLTRSLNRGLALARGKYVARMDSDDVSMHTRLQAEVADLEADENLDLVGSFFDIVDEQGNLIERKELILDPIYRLWRLQFHNNYGHGSVMFRKDSVKAAGMYDESLRFAQDYDLWSRLTMKSNTKVIPEVLYRYRMVSRGGQASVANYDAQLFNAIRVSNRSLMACNPSLTETDCEELRAIYWKFQRDFASPNGLAALSKTVEGFCRRFDISGVEKLGLVRQVIHDALEEVEKVDPALSGEWRDTVEELEKYERTVEIN